MREFEQSGLKRKVFARRAVWLFPGSTLAAVVTGGSSSARRRQQRSWRRQSWPAASGGGGMRVELANGRRVVVEAGFDASHLRRLMAALEG